MLRATLIVACWLLPAMVWAQNDEPSNDGPMKKQAWLVDKTAVTGEELPKKFAEWQSKSQSKRPGNEWSQSLRKRQGKPAEPIVVVRNLHLNEVIALDADVDYKPPRATWSSFARCHYTLEESQMPLSLPNLLVRAAVKFKRYRIDMVSGFRHPKYNMILRKKGRGVAKNSQHSLGNAIDFRIRGVATRRLWLFIKQQRLGGVGYYPISGFVHADTGRVRYWKGR